MQKTLAAIMLFGGLSGSLVAGPISGTFTIDGSVTVTGTSITWLSNSSVPDQATISSLGLSGDFASFGNQTVGIHDLSALPPDQPVGTPFPNYDFIDFAVSDMFPSLEVDFIAFGSGSQADCSTDVSLAMPGQTCTLTPTTTPAAPLGSPFTFLNAGVGANGCCNSSATWDMGGVTSDGMSTWSGVFTSDFAAPANDPNAADGSFQAVLNQFSTTGQVSDAFAGKLTVSIQQIQSVPEPGTMILLGSGLILLGVGSRRVNRKKSH